MFRLKILVICACFISFSDCDFSEIVNIDGIINNSTQLPDLDDQIVPGNEQSSK